MSITLFFGLIIVFSNFHVFLTAKRDPKPTKRAHIFEPTFRNWASQTARGAHFDRNVEAHSEFWTGADGRPLCGFKKDHISLPDARPLRFKRQEMCSIVLCIVQGSFAKQGGALQLFYTVSVGEFFFESRHLRVATWPARMAGISHVIRSMGLGPRPRQQCTRSRSVLSVLRGFAIHEGSTRTRAVTH